VRWVCLTLPRAFNRQSRCIGPRILHCHSKELSVEGREYRHIVVAQLLPTAVVIITSEAGWRCLNTFQMPNPSAMTVNIGGGFACQ
jgi:hypothetical protein